MYPCFEYCECTFEALLTPCTKSMTQHMIKKVYYFAIYSRALIALHSRDTRTRPPHQISRIEKFAYLLHRPNYIAHESYKASRMAEQLNLTYNFP